MQLRRQSDHFYPRSPRGERPFLLMPMLSPPNFYPRSPRGERQYGPQTGRPHYHISIHAPREGSDFDFYHPMLANLGISIHAPREGSDGFSGRWVEAHKDISIHAPREGSDWHDLADAALCIQFLSTLPARGATAAVGAELGGREISIHAPREGSDCHCGKKRGQNGPDFYPRSPRGERPPPSGNNRFII